MTAADGTSRAQDLTTRSTMRSTTPMDDPDEEAQRVREVLVAARNLETEFASTWIEIDEDALVGNLDTLREFLGDETVLTQVVKGNAYGHGYHPAVPIAERAGIRNFAVFSVSEAVAFKAAASKEARLQIMGHVGEDAVPWAVENDCEPWIGSIHLWPLFRDEIERQRKKVRFHVELETGMNRTGLTAEWARAVVEEIMAHPYAELEGVCTHLAGAEDHRNNARITLQKHRYFSFVDSLAESGIKPRYRHIASSSAAILDEEARLDLVRVGIASYGFWPTKEVLLRHRIRESGDIRLRLDRALAWKSRVMKVHEVQDGDFVGYGDLYQAEGPERVGIVPVGYADGFSRALANLGHVLVRGRRASIIGAVNMNMIQIHLTHLPDVDVGDEVVVVGRQGDQEISVSSFADYNNVVNYELMSRLPVDIPRRVVANGRERTI